MSKFKEWSAEIILGAGAILGLILIILPLSLRWEFDHGISLAIGTALLIACIVAVTIELWMTKRIARDVFKAAFGYSMPDHFKSEIMRIADQRLICVKHRMYVNIETLDEDTVRVTTSTHRDIKNIGPNTESIPCMVHIDEWGFPEQSNILRCEVSRDQEMIRCSPDDINKLSDSSIRAETKAIKLKRNSTATTVSVSTAIRRINDDLMWGFLTPTENPVIQLSLPENLDGKADAGIPGSEEGKSTVVPYQYEFTGVYFPPAHMRVRWWPKEQAQLTVESREIATP